MGRPLQGRIAGGNLMGKNRIPRGLLYFFYSCLLIQSAALTQFNLCSADDKRNIIPENMVYVAIESHELNEAISKDLTKKTVNDALFALAEVRATLFCYYHSFEKLESFTLSFRNTDAFRLGTAYEFAWMSSFEPVTLYPRAKLSPPDPVDPNQSLQNAQYLEGLMGKHQRTRLNRHVPHLVFTELVCSKKPL